MVEKLNCLNVDFALLSQVSQLGVKAPFVKHIKCLFPFQSIFGWKVIHPLSVFPLDVDFNFPAATQRPCMLTYEHQPWDTLFAYS